MKKAIPRTALFMAAALLLATPLHAESFRCGRKLVTTGDSSGELIRKCGQPGYKDRGQEKIRIDGVYKKAGVERWHYKQSARSLEHVIMVYKGRVVAVETGGR